MIKIKSPLYYNGNKFSLLDKINPHIPKNKEGTFYDLFGGSGTMSLNYTKKYKRVCYNELDPKVFKMFDWALNHAEPVPLRKRILELDNKYNFILNPGPGESREGIVSSGLANKRPEYQGWLKFIQEEKIKTDQEPELLYIASCFAFSNTLKFKNDGYLQASWGVYEYRDMFINKFGNMKSYREKITCTNMPFQKLYLEHLTKNDFVYLDPPYMGTEGNYNKFWTMEQELELFALCEKLTSNGIKFAMSNVYENKGKKNTHLKEWAEKNNFQVWHFKHSYTLHGTTGVADEVLICNYFHDETPQPIAFDFAELERG